MIVTEASNRNARLLIEDLASDNQRLECSVCLGHIKSGQPFYSHESGKHLAVHRPCLISWVALRGMEESLTCFICRDKIDYRNNNLFIDVKNALERADKMAEILEGLERELTCIITASHVYPLARDLRSFAPHARIDLNSWTPLSELRAQLESVELVSNLERLPQDLRVLLQEYTTIHNALLELKRIARSMEKSQWVFLKNVQHTTPYDFPLSQKEKKMLMAPNVPDNANTQIIDQMNVLIGALKGLHNNPLSKQHIELIHTLEKLIERTKSKNIIKGLSFFLEKIPEQSVSSALFLLFLPSALNGVLAAGMTLSLQATGMDLGERTLFSLSVLAMVVQTAYFIKHTAGNNPLTDVVFFHLLSLVFDSCVHAVSLALIEQVETWGVMCFIATAFLFNKHAKNRMLGIYSNALNYMNIKLVNISAYSLAAGVLAGRLSKVHPVAITALYAMLVHLNSHTNRIWVRVD